MKPKVYLYNRGDIGSITGGFSANGWTAASFGLVSAVPSNEYVSFNGVKGKETIYPTINQIDFGKYRHLFIDVNVLKTYQNYSAFAVNLYTEKLMSSSVSIARVGTPEGGTGHFILDLDVSDIDVPAYICPHVEGVVDYKAQLNRMWLE